MNISLKELVKKMLTTLSTPPMVTRIVAGSVTASYASHTSMTAPSISGYTFVGWGAVATVGWVGSVYPSAPQSQTSDFWVASANTSSGAGTINALAIYRRA